MSVNSQITRTRIMECASKEFMEYGYQSANMRRIAQAANVTTGAMYNHFSNKAVLFDALVQAPAEEMLDRFRGIHAQFKADLPKLTFVHMKETAYLGTDWMLEYIYAHFEAFRLIFCRSEGTRWVSYLEELIAVEERAYCDAFGKRGRRVEDMFLHIIAASGFQYLVECVSHDLSYEKAVAVLDSAKRFSMAGWQELFKL
ncbi:TetR/AcrR family transcriptional regulator [Oscillibacter sp.]|uniref:TetR/AcrR family transcriptional regulator n=1 Tax=Oscillibacter sp. TaxID=1945593 RepID=UPI0028AA636F|nr:TetR/AcrR family transcriptional regulator [Oscillibacter sp.]